jgi:hydrogenase-4 component F
VCAALIVVLAAIGLIHAGTPATGPGYVIDGPGGVFLAVIGVVGLISALISPAYLHDHRRARTGALRSRQLYYAGLYLFWAALVALPVVNNLGIAWLVVEATTAASALMVAFAGTRNALEAAWKYLVLTSVGLTVALMGIVMLYASGPHGAATLSALDWSTLAHQAPHLDQSTTLVAFCVILAGLATKVGWAPVHNWLPDAHSEAPPPVSALLSAALLPTVALVAWRLDQALRAALDARAVQAIFIGFGLLSLGVAIPFLWKLLAWKRFLAYSSLEHMGVIAFGIGIDNRWATAGVLIHVAGHAIAKALGFSMAIPLLRYQPAASQRAPRGIARLSRPLSMGMGVSLFALGAVPPSPLFFSEALILFGGFVAGQVVVTSIAAVLLAMGFIGVAHMAIEAFAGAPLERRLPGSRTAVWISGLATACTVGLLAVASIAYVLPYSTLAAALTGGAG